MDETVASKYLYWVPEPEFKRVRTLLEAQKYTLSAAFLTPCQVMHAKTRASLPGLGHLRWRAEERLLGRQTCFDRGGLTETPCYRRSFPVSVASVSTCPG